MSDSNLPDYSSPSASLIEFLAVQIIVCGAATFVASLRLIARFFISRNPSWADYLMILATCLAVLQTVLTLTCIPSGLASVAYDVPQIADFLQTYKLSYAQQILYPICVAAIHLSILFAYFELSSSIIFWRWIKCVMIVALIAGISFTFARVFQCVPIAKNWNDFLPGRCISQQGFFMVQVSCYVTLDLMIVLLPISTLWRLRVPKRERILIGCIFLLGIIPFVSLIIRFLALPRLHGSLPTMLFEQPWELVAIQNWIMAEYSTGIICASLPHTKPLLEVMLPGLLGIDRKHSAISQTVTLRGNNAHVLQTLDYTKYREDPLASISSNAWRSRSVDSADVRNLGKNIKVTTNMTTTWHYPRKDTLTSPFSC